MELQLKNQLAELKTLPDIIADYGREHQLTPQAVLAVDLALEELLSNIIYYGYDDAGEHQIKVKFTLTEAELAVQVEDDGRPFDPLQYPVVDTSVALEQKQVGGLGIHIIRKMMDATEYRREQDRNIFLMKKFRPS